MKLWVLRLIQQSSEEVIRLGCLLSLVMPYELASWMLSQWSGLSVSASSLWSWVQQRGQQAQTALMEQLQAQADGAEVSPEPLDATLAALPLAIGADGVMAG